MSTDAVGWHVDFGLLLGQVSDWALERFVAYREQYPRWQVRMVRAEIRRREALS